MGKKNKDRLEIQELFMGKAGWHRTFIGTIERYTQEDGSPYVFGKIPVNDFVIIATAKNDVELGEKLDDLVILILDYNLHEMKSKRVMIAGTDIHLN